MLVVDDEPQILRALRVVLRDAGFEAMPASTAQEALDLAALHPPDAAIVDLLLPDGDGIEVTRALREWTKAPIIVLSAVGEEEQKVRALEAGADDYVTKPFGPRELVARLAATLRRATPEPGEPVLRADGLELDLAAHVVRVDGEDVHLTPIEFALLTSLMTNRGRLLTHARSSSRSGSGVRGRHGDPAHPHRQPAPQDRPGPDAPLHPDRPGRRLPVRGLRQADPRDERAVVAARDHVDARGRHPRALVDEHVVDRDPQAPVRGVRALQADAGRVAASL